MGRPNRTILIAEELHAVFAAQLGTPAKVPRETFDSVMQKHYRIGTDQGEKVGRVGEQVGLWKRHRRRGTRVGYGWIELLALPEAIELPHTE